MTDQVRLLGAVMVAMSAVTWSTAGIFTKGVSADVWTIMFWRGLFAAGFVFLYVCWREKTGAFRQLRELGWIGWTVATVSSLATLAFLSSFKLTSVANVVLIYATAPFVAAGIVWLWKRERMTRTTFVASVCCLIGVAVIVAGSLGAPNLAGDVLAMLMTFGMALLIVMIRLYPDAPTVMAAGCISSLQLAALGWLLSDVTAILPQELLVLVAFGIVQAVGVVLLTEGSRLVPAPDAALLGSLEVPLAPVWAWLILSETLPAATAVGGAIVLSALFWYLVNGVRLRR